MRDNRAFYKTLAAAAVALLGVLAFFSIKGYTAVHAAQVTACEHSVEPGGARYIIAHAVIQGDVDTLSAQIKESKGPSARAFVQRLNIPRPQIKALVRQQNDARRVQIANKRTQIAELLGVDCQHP